MLQKINKSFIDLIQALFNAFKVLISKIFFQSRSRDKI